MLDFNDLLVAVPLFPVLIAQVSHVSGFWFRCIFVTGLKTLTLKNACCPLCQKLCALTSSQVSSEQQALLVKTSHVAQLQHHDILQKGCKQVSHFIVPPMNTSTFHTFHSMINFKSIFGHKDMQMVDTSVSSGT